MPSRRGMLTLEQLTTLDQGVGHAVAALNRIEAKMRTEGGSEVAPSLDPLSSQLLKMHRLLQAQLAARPDGQTAASAAANAGDTGGEQAAAPGVIRSREDAIRALDAVTEFFRRNEPSSPIPLLLARAKRLVSKSFLDVLADIAPDALGVARAAGGLKEGD